MNANIQTITLDLTNSAFSAAQKVSVVQGDSGTRPVKAIITDNGVVRTDLSHNSARIYISNVPGEPPTYVEGILIINGVAEFCIPQSATLQPGIKNGELRLVGENEKVLSSTSFMVDVNPSQYDEKALLGTDKGDVLERMIEETSENKSAAEESAEAARKSAEVADDAAKAAAESAAAAQNAATPGVSYSQAQNLTDEQKATARNNIGAVDASLVTDNVDNWNKIPNGNGLSNFIRDNIHYYPVVLNDRQQSFTDVEKAQARDNIDAISQAELDEAIANVGADGKGDKLPSIYVDERNAVLDEVQSQNADLRLVTFTDTHDFSANKYKKYGDLMASGCIDGLVGLGDYQIYSNDITKTETIRKITEIFRYSGRNPNCIYAVGNHDVAYISANSGAPDQSKVLTKKELHDCFNRHLNGSVRFNDADPYGCYYYTDFDASKIRMIVLNTSDIYEPSGILKYKYKESVMMQQPQISWLVNNALDFSDKSNPTEWSVIVCQHAYFDTSVGMISDILSAVKNGTSLNKSWTFKRIVDNPDTTEPSNLLPIELAKESYSAVGITITHDNGTFTINGTATTSYSFEIVTKGNDYGQLKAGVKYKIALNKISGTATNLPPKIVLKTRKADGTETAYQNYATGDDFTFTLSENETLIRFAIMIGAKDYGYTDFVCQPSLTAVEGISDESQIETVISANKDFSEQGAVDVIAVLYGHDHVNTQSVTKGINFIEFISDSAFVDDYYNVSVSGLTAGGYYITNSNGIKIGFTVSSDLPEAVTIGYNNYHAKYNASAPIRVQNGDGATIFSCTAKPSNYQDGMMEITGFIQERTPNTVKTESCSVVSINKDTRTIKIVPYGTGIYREITY